MCGICGVISRNAQRERGQVEAMAAALAHRGPDDNGFYCDDNAILGHRRLTIIDLHDGRQPLSNSNGRFWITYNGEIYNYRQLRSQLEDSGHQFKTQTDTEVVVHLFEEHGPSCLQHLRGMFAFAIWDTERQSLFAARDRLGQKPFYYSVQPGRFLFASEIKGLLAHGGVSADMEPAAIDFYLALRFVPPPLTMLRDIRKLAAGTCLTWENGELRLEPYWTLDFSHSHSRKDADWLEELGERVDEAIHSHLVSDVPVGAFLSGGLDSSLVVASIARHGRDPVQTFSIGSDVSSFDETPFARQVATHCGTKHRERFVSARQLAGIPRLVRSLDEPSDPISACMFEAARFASEHVKVVLGGDGGDEIFAGFDRYAAFGWASRYAWLPRWIREDVCRPLLRGVPESFAYKSFAQRAQWLDALGGERGGRLYARMTSFFRFGPEERAWTYGPALLAGLQTAQAEEAISKPFELSETNHVLHRMLFADVVTRLPEHTLMLTDRLSMAHGLETRAPLLDHQLAEFCATMPANLKIRRGTTKFAMREVARKRLPRSIIERPKQGFMFPVAHWLNAHTLNGIKAHLLASPLLEQEFIKKEAVERLMEEHRRRRVDHHVRIWMLLNLDTWHRMYIGGSTVDEELERTAEVGASGMPTVAQGS